MTGNLTRPRMTLQEGLSWFSLMDMKNKHPTFQTQSVLKTVRTLSRQFISVYQWDAEHALYTAHTWNRCDVKDAKRTCFWQVCVTQSVHVKYMYLYFCDSFISAVSVSQPLWKPNPTLCLSFLVGLFFMACVVVWKFLELFRWRILDNPN